MFLRPRVLVQLPLGFGSGLPYLLTGSTLVARLGSAGVPIDVIAPFALVSMPYSCKPLWAPLIDRYALPLLGRRRGWMLLLQLALVATLALLGAVATAPSLLPLALVALLALTGGAWTRLGVGSWEFPDRWLRRSSSETPNSQLQTPNFRLGGAVAATALMTLSALALWRRLRRTLPSPPRPAIYGGA